MTSAIDRVLCLVAVPFLFVSLAQDASAQETAKGLLAAQARAQGYRCDKRSAPRRMQNDRVPTRPFGFSGANAIPTRCG